MGSNGLPLSMTDGDKPELIWGEMVTGNYFSGLGVHPAAGRGFLPEEDDKPGEKPVCVPGGRESTTSLVNESQWRGRLHSGRGDVAELTGTCGYCHEACHQRSVLCVATPLAVWRAAVIWAATSLCGARSKRPGRNFSAVYCGTRHRSFSFRPDGSPARISDDRSNWC